MFYLDCSNALQLNGGELSCGYGDEWGHGGGVSCHTSSVVGAGDPNRGGGTLGDFP